MIGKTANALAPSALPTLADLRQRTAELLEIQSQLLAQSPEPDLDPPSRSDQAPRSSLAPPQRPTNPACPACPGTPRSEPWVLGEAAPLWTGRARRPYYRSSHRGPSGRYPPSVAGLPLAVWDYCSASASHLFGDSTGDAIADRIREALEESPQGLSKYQIRRLFHGHVSCDRIDAALEQLMLIDAAGYHSEPTRGRSSTLWSATAQQQAEENGISEGDLDEFAAEEGVGL
jgi:hypothetical protein